MISAILPRSPRTRTPRRAPAAALLAGLLLAAGVAQGAQPSAPDRLPAEVQGVVGSGDQLSLKLKDAAGGRTIRPGEVYADGWTLKAVSASTATLAKDGQERVVGLNPSGAVASAAPPVGQSTVTIAGLPDEATIQAYMAKGYARYGADFMSPEEAADPDQRRGAVYNIMIQEEIDRRRAAAIAAGGDGQMVGMSGADMRAFLGEAAYNDQMAIAARVVAQLEAKEAADLATRPITGPSSYYLPAGGNPRQAQQAAGVDPRGVWQSGLPDAQGGRTMTRVAETSAGVRTALAGLAPAPADAAAAAADVAAPAARNARAP